MRTILFTSLCCLLAQAARADGIDIDDAWARATPPGVTTAAAYLSVTADAGGDRLLGASSPRAARVEMHATVSDGGVMRMTPLDALPIAADTTIRFEPGGRHLMFVDIDGPFRPGEQVMVTLRFERAGEIAVSIPVRDARAEHH
jgi:hypothetical protein